MNLPPHESSLVVATDGFWDPDASNGLRARSAQDAMLYYCRQRGFDTDEITCTIDLITDLFHHLHALGENPLKAMDLAKSYFMSEVCDRRLKR